ncbi:MAG: sodium:solute symporter, partial [Caulobacterales bacterium]|nr:sodium:solute symporter [Caulobacterales bacterium]
LVTFTFMLLAVLWAPQIARFESLFKYLQAVLAYTVAPVVALFLIGAFWRRANAAGAMWALVLGTGSGAGLFMVNQVMGLTDIHFLYVGPILLVISAAGLVVGSYTKPAPDAEEVARYVWTPQYFAEEARAMKGRAWYADYRYQVAGLLALTAIILAAFW